MSIWTIKPPLGSSVNRAHPLAHGLVSCFLCNEGGGSKVLDIANGTYSLAKNAYATWGVRYSHAGLITNTTDPANANALCPTSMKIAFPITVFWKGTFLGQPSVYTNIFGVTYTNSDSTPNYPFQVATRGSNNLGGWYSLNLSGGSQISTDIVPAAGDKHFIVLTIGNGYQALYIDGVYQGSNTDTVIAEYTSNSSVIIGHPSFNARSAACITDICGFYNRVLTPTEIWNLFTSPYQFITRPEVGVYCVSSSGATVTPSAQSLSLTLPTPTLSAGAVESPSALSASLTLPTPAVAGNANFNAPALSLSLALPAPTETAGAIVTPSALSLSSTIQSTTEQAGAITTPSAQALSLTLPAPTVSGGGAGGATFNAPALSLAATLGGITVNGGANISPAVLALALSPISPAFACGSNISPSVLALSLTLQTITKSGGANVSPSVLSLTSALLSILTSGGANVSPSILTLALNLVTPGVGSGIYVKVTRANNSPNLKQVLRNAPNLKQILKNA